MRQSKNRPSAFQAGCSKRRLNLALVFCLFCVIFVFLVFCVSWYFGVIVILCCQYQCSWLPGRTVTEMTCYVLTGTLSNCSLTHSLTVVIVPAATATDHYVLHMFFIYIVFIFSFKALSPTSINRHSWNLRLCRSFAMLKCFLAPPKMMGNTSKLYKLSFASSHAIVCCDYTMLMHGK